LSKTFGEKHSCRTFTGVQYSGCAHVRKSNLAQTIDLGEVGFHSTRDRGKCGMSNRSVIWAIIQPCVSLFIQLRPIRLPFKQPLLKKQTSVNCLPPDKRPGIV